jgi:aspartyl-tRNA(Asn)/glutamyl-tRNA(Gln) amidotransferase subunit A
VRPTIRVYDSASVSDLALLPLHAVSALLHARKVSSAELVRACLERIDRYDKTLGAFITLTADAATEEAKRADARLAAGEDSGPLHGIPIALKDLFDTAGVRTTAGSRILADRVPAEDAVAVAHLRAAGCVLLGKLNLHEWAFGVTNQNPHFGPTVNPYDPTRIPGGSSGGSAAALAAGFCYLAPGTDTGGSIRIPSALCGVAGLKPTYGRVSVRGVIPLAWTLDHAGPLARTSTDLALALNAMAGHDARDPLSIDVPTEDYTRDLEKGARGLRALVPANHFFDDVDPEVERAVREAIATLRSLGATIEERPLPMVDRLDFAQSMIIRADAAAYHSEDLRVRASDIGGDVLERLRNGERVTGVQYAQARHERDLLRHAWTELLNGYDVILTPTTRVPAPPRSGEDAVAMAGRLTANTSPFNLTGLPTVSVPCGFTSAGLPIGLQLAAGPWREALVLRAARAYERATNWHERMPLH